MREKGQRGGGGSDAGEGVTWRRWRWPRRGAEEEAGPPAGACGCGSVVTAGCRASARLRRPGAARTSGSAQEEEPDDEVAATMMSGQVGSNMNLDGELRKIKDQFATWKKDYKSRLKETKADKMTTTMSSIVNGGAGTRPEFSLSKKGLYM
ncbi:Os03g0578500 [Oryza sativa Japonica Group]|uniref:Os03g0578500 protein n=2 Tax=Oryza sativa subsp. japonica TaxID=39947 RepID=C7J089_ORYSJ|nr:hypothetical protein [Oryza sativa Japonica Group]ABF97277.1 expressed protein [Oryza sativa Japonica Group]BAH92237.1 Os03g0578500 [Oryza sativa Japonica Group]|eukprot:NP_001173509.1 Os03g0578500 [Oryza sativa Japonica Group]